MVGTPRCHPSEMGELRPSLLYPLPGGEGAARLGGWKGERSGRGDVGASGDALSGVAVLFITTTTTSTIILHTGKAGIRYTTKGL